MLAPERIARAERVGAACRAAGLRVVTAESCTGGGVAACLSAVAGASAVLERGYVTYSNLAKQQALAVPAALLAQYGAVSPETARAMAEGALATSPAELALAVTGIAGPDGGSSEKPVGLVYLALARRNAGAATVERHLFAGDRHQVRAATLDRALTLLLAAAGG